MLEKHFLVELRGNVGDGLAGDESLSVDVGKSVCACLNDTKDFIWM